MSEQPGRVVAVLGMHRSGTSCLTGSLQAAGLYLGDCHTWNRYNTKGNRENQAFVDLHDAILAASGGAWDRPPWQVNWSPEHSARAAALLARHGSSPILGFKDPRTLLVLDGWKALRPDLECVGIFRHPAAVAESLHNRSQMDRAEALRLWYDYNQVLYREYRRKPFPLLCFDDDEACFKGRLDTVIRQLGLQPVVTSQQFYDDDLKHFSACRQQRLPWRLGWLYHRLRRASRRSAE